MVPLAVLCPASAAPYHEAKPLSKTGDVLRGGGGAGGASLAVGAAVIGTVARGSAFTGALGSVDAGGEPQPSDARIQTSRARKLDPDARAAAFAILRVRTTAVRFGDALHERQTQTDRLAPLRVLRLAAIERLEDLLLFAR